jgi:zinc transport system ATP-binding protein
MLSRQHLKRHSRTAGAEKATSMARGAAVVIQDLFVAYDETAVLQDVNLTIEEGDFVAVIGPNGGGKTTLLKAILGLVRPTRGTIRVFGRSPCHACSAVGYVPQRFQFDPMFPVSVMDVVLMGRLRRGGGFGPFRGADRRYGERALREVNLYPIRERSFASLSGGERQRVLIARALATDPALLLLDEPLAHVDMAAVDELYRLFQDLSAQRTVVLVSHDVGFVSSLVRRVVCVNRTVAMHPTREISGDLISQLYQTHVHLVRHDLDCGHRGES